MSYPAYSEYKDSGVEWLGRIPIHWAMKPLKYVSYINSDMLSEATDDGFEFEYVDIGSVSFGSGIQKTEKIQFSSAPSRARRLVKNGDVIVSTVRTYLRAIAAIKEHAEKYVVSTGFCVVTPVGEINSEYCSYMLQSPYFVETVVAGSVGVSYPATNASDIANIDISLPQKEEQTQIATFLDRETQKIDRLIEKQQQLIKLLQEKRQAVISHAVTKGLNPDVEMKESGVEWLGEIPEHWGVNKSKYHFAFTTSGSRGWAEHYSDEGELFFRITNLTRDTIDPKLESIKYVNPPAGAEGERSMIEIDDLLISITADIGSVCVATKEISGGYVSQHVALCRPDAAVSNSRWLGYYILSNAAREQLLGVGYGGTKIQLSLDDIRGFIVATPPFVEQSSIADFLDMEIARIDNIFLEVERSIGLLKERRTALISAAVTGKIDVRSLVNG